MTLLERDALLLKLQDRLADARGGRGQLVLLAGEAGIGKTALVDGFTSRLPRGTSVLRGACDPVVPARPFAPIVDMANQVRDGLRAAIAAADRDRVFERFLAVLREQGTGAVIVFEDLHWADSATLDLLRIVGRRLPETPVLLIGTYRAHEVPDGHPLRLALGDMPPGLVNELRVPPLSVAAVATLAAGTAIDAGLLHEATAGNPFFVTEVVARGGDALPASIRDTVGARFARLSAEAQEVLRATAVLGPRVEPRLIAAVTGAAGAPGGIREAMAREMLLDYGGLYGFRHELARRAVLDALAPADRIRLHGRALAALRSGVASEDAIRLLQLAIEAGDGRSIVELAPRAADQSIGLGAYAEASDFLAVVLALPTDFDQRTRAQLLERYAFACSMSDRIAAARTAELSALDLWHQLGDRLREGDGLRALATYMWLGGEGDRAREVALEAVGVLELISPRGHELADAYAKVAQLVVNSGQDDAAGKHWAELALDLAERIGDEPVAVHALTTLALAEIYPGAPAGVGRLEEALGRARAAGLTEDITRILINLVETAHDQQDYALADRYAKEAVQFLRDHEFELYGHLLSSRIAQLALEQGRWDSAEQQARALLAGTARSNQVRVRALGVLGRISARRGGAGTWAYLDEAMGVVGLGEFQDICPLHAARAEAAWLDGDIDRAGDEAMAGLTLAAGTGAPFWHSELSFWAWRTGRLERMPDGTAQAYVLHAAGDYRAAAAAWARIGCPYQRAEALGDSADEGDLRGALDILQRLGASVLEARVRSRMRERGVRRIPRGPRASSRANPAGLSAREAEVLRLVCLGFRNSDIAERLVLSTKTVDHHVSAVLRKLGVSTRQAAREEAGRLGLQHGELRSPT
jgi:ATP/maltotriose-dependent transcriptional regulator MalT